MTEEQWDCVHFTDESKFNLFGCDGKRFVRCSPKQWYSPQCTKNSAKFRGGSVMVFGLVDVDGTRPLVRLHGKLTHLYTTRYWRNMLNLIWDGQLIYQPTVFVQNNAPCLTTKSVKTFLSDEGVTVMEWPAQSPDMNPIEKVWKLLNERAKRKESKKRRRTMN